MFNLTSYTLNLIPLFFAVILVACGGSDHAEDPPIEPQTTEFDYQAFIDGLTSEYVPGIVLHIETPEKSVLISSGYANLETLEPMPVNAQMPAGSAGKKLTALLALQLQEEGLLDLDNTIDTWLSEDITSHIENSEAITLRQLLNHTAGVYDYLEDETAYDFYEILFYDSGQLRTDEFALSFALDKASYFFPGEGWQYSNTGYLLAGLILDAVLGEHHSAALRDRILVPFGLDSSYYCGVESDKGNIVSGYYFDEGERFDTKIIYEYLGVADAPIVSTAEDLTRLLRTLVDESNLISAEIQNEMFGSEFQIDTGSGLNYGLGLAIEEILGHRVYHHNGLELGYSTTNLYIPSQGISVSAFLNCGVNEECEQAQDTLTETVVTEELR